MKKVLVPLAPGFEEIETVTIVDILRRAGARVTLAGTEEGVLQGSRGINLVADSRLNEVDPEEFDLVVLPGGQPGTSNLQKDERVAEILKAMARSGKTIAAICAAPLVLQSAGLLKDKTTTSHPSIKDELKEIQYSEDRVAVDGNLVTSRGPGTAMEFAMKLVEILFDKDRMETVNKGVMAKL
ncbi:MAG: 4-methyl-5(B-hydroxyethyl)-thiazole monophosphate biosynthesis protein [Nitrospinaceae bacterium]|nr:MAG: 4-methyl-5(B-hydroxyethyl)-thiazole monophosphate biosynthesis protein [Nitrospinaceae bacterium]